MLHKPLTPEERMGPLAAQRRAKENKVQATASGKIRRVSVLGLGARIIRGGLKVAGVYMPMARVATQLDIIEREVRLPRLPRALEGARILHLSDLHIDSFPGFGAQLAELVAALSFELAVVTGDFRFTARGSHEPAIEGLRPLCEVLRCAPLGAFAVLGNHDTLDMVLPMEAMGLRVLLNERVEREGLCLAGVDDSYFFGTWDLEKALQGAPQAQPRILLSHAPELARRAARRGVDLYLCGHTHGGQVCLPGGVPVVVNTAAGRGFVAGSWQVEKMRGYTSRGVGFSSVPVRSFCRPEIVLHRLRRP